MKQINVMLALLMMLGAGIAGAASQTAYTAYFASVATVATVNNNDTVLILQGGVVKQTAVSNVRTPNQIQFSGTITVGNCLQWAAVSPPTITQANGGCVIPGPNPFLTAN